MIGGKSMTKDNIIYFVADQLRSDAIHHNGNSASITPNLDALLEEGVSFENAYCQNPVCVPSRNSFLTGLYPHTNGHRTMHYLQREDEPNILREFMNNGYEVIWIGRNDIIPATRSKEEYCHEFYDGVNKENRVHFKVEPNSVTKHPQQTKEEFSIDDDRYYSFYIGKLSTESEYKNFDWNCLDQALTYIERKSEEPDSKPFFLYVTLTFPHPPYACEDPWYSSIDRNSLMERRPTIDTLENRPSMLHGIVEKQNMKTWTEERWNELRATYLAMVSRFDHQFGLLKESLIHHNLYNRSNIFVFSDHGDYTGDYGIVEKVQNCFENPISNVPLIIKPSDKYDVVPRKSKALVELVDLSATIAELAGFELSYTQFGKSMVHLFDKETEHKDAVFCEGGRIHGEKQAMELGHGPQSPYYPRLATQYSEGPEHTKATMIRMGNYKYTKRLYETDEFYDLEKDPFELHNAIFDEEYQDIITKMKYRMLDYFMETGDFVPNKRDIR